MSKSQEWQQMVLHTARVHKYEWTVMASGAWLILIWGRQALEEKTKTLYRLVKGRNEAVTEEEHEQHSALYAAGNNVAIWRPQNKEQIIKEITHG